MKIFTQNLIIKEKKNKERSLSLVCELYQISNDLDNEVITINCFRTFPTPIDQFIHSKESSFFFNNEDVY
jgi:hypothetical protein